MSKTMSKLYPEWRGRAVRLVLETEGQHASRWQAAMSIARRYLSLAPTLVRSA